MNETSQISQLRAKSSISLSPTLTGLAFVPATRVHPLPGHVSCISFGCVKGLDQRLRTSLNSSIGGWAPYFSCAVGFVTRKSKARKYVAEAAVKFWGMRKFLQKCKSSNCSLSKKVCSKSPLDLLCDATLLGRHVEVVHKDQATLTKGRAIAPFFPEVSLLNWMEGWKEKLFIPQSCTACPTSHRSHPSREWISLEMQDTVIDFVTTRADRSIHS